MKLECSWCGGIYFDAVNSSATLTISRDECPSCSATPEQQEANRRRAAAALAAREEFACEDRRAYAAVGAAIWSAQEIADMRNRLNDLEATP